MRICLLYFFLSIKRKGDIPRRTKCVKFLYTELVLPSLYKLQITQKRITARRKKFTGHTVLVGLRPDCVKNLHVVGSKPWVSGGPQRGSSIKS